MEIRNCAEDGSVTSQYLDDDLNGLEALHELAIACNLQSTMPPDIAADVVELRGYGGFLLLRAVRQEDRTYALTMGVPA